MICLNCGWGEDVVMRYTRQRLNRQIFRDLMRRLRDVIALSDG